MKSPCSACSRPRGGAQARGQGLAGQVPVPRRRRGEPGGDSPEALAYLEARGLNHPQLVDTFKLGVADRTLGLRLPEKNRKDGAAIRERLQRIGILRETGHEHFNGSLVVPVFDAAGNVVEVYGRKLLDNLRP